MGRDFRGGRRIEGVVYYLHREMRMENPRFGDCITCWTRFVFFALLKFICVVLKFIGPVSSWYLFLGVYLFTQSVFILVFILRRCLFAVVGVYFVNAVETLKVDRKSVV